MTTKPIIIGVSLILVVGVVIGAVLVNRNGHTSDNKNLSTNIKAVDAICKSTTYKDKCMSTIAPVAANSSAGPKEFIRAVLVASVEEMKVALEKSKSVKIDNLIRIDQLALEECKNFIQYAVEDLEVLLGKLNEKELKSVNDEVYDFRIWLSSVITYQVTCLDQLGDPNLKAVIQNVLLNSTLLTNNAADIFAELSTILLGFNIPLDINPSHRKLLDVGSVDEQGNYPHWFSEGDRRLLVEEPKPDAIVSQNGGGGPGNFKTIAEAINSYPSNKKPPPERFVIYVKAGTYKEENLTVPKSHLNIYMYGDGPDKTIITGSKSVKGSPSYPTSATGSFTVIGGSFVGKSMAFINTAGADGEQAVALRVQSDKAAFINCNLDGFQDTLYTHTGRQFYRECNISGTVDFVFGQGAVVIQNSLITVKKAEDEKKNQNFVAADGRNHTSGIGGVVFQNCRIVPHAELRSSKTNITSYLGRPWKEWSTAIFVESFIDDFITPLGFSIWNETDPYNTTCHFWEYKNTGPGAKTDGRVKWPECHKVFPKPTNELLSFTLNKFLHNGTGMEAQWLKPTGIPFTPEF